MTAKGGGGAVLFPNRKPCCAIGSRCVNSTPSRRASTGLSCDAFLLIHSHGIHWFTWRTFQKTSVLSVPQNIISGSTKWEALGNKSLEFEGRSGWRQLGEEAGSRQDSGAGVGHGTTVLSGNRPASHFLSTRTWDRSSMPTTERPPDILCREEHTPQGNQASRSILLRIWRCDRRRFLLLEFCWAS